MPDNDYDRACRYLLRSSGAPLLCWLLGLDPAHLRFVRWLDTRLTIPGWPERIGDAMAHVQRLDQGGVPWLNLIEFQAQPDPQLFGRLLVYEGMSWLLEKPTELIGDRFQLQAIVVNLTGIGHTGRHMIWSEGAGTSLLPVERNLEEYLAATALEEIADGRAPRVALAWIPLMKGGAEPAIMQRWRELAEQEPDPHARADLALALVFADLVGRRKEWTQALEGFNVFESSVVREWMAEATAMAQAQGRSEGRQEGLAEGLASLAAAVRAVLEARFGTPAAEVATQVTAARGADVLKRWNVLAARSDTLEQFRQATGI